MPVRIDLLALKLVAAIAVSSFASAFGADAEKTTRGTSDAGTGVTKELLASIRLGLIEADAPNAGDGSKLLRVTPEPFQVLSGLCSGPSPDDVHTGFWIHVYVTPKARDTLVSGKGIYPRGTLILKRKCTDAAGKNTELFTGMLKREQGFNAETKDWEFFVLNGNATAVPSESRVAVRPTARPFSTQSCMRCHALFRDTDFVSRSYLEQATRREKWSVRDPRTP